MTNVFDGNFQAAIPLIKRIETPDGIKYSIDITGTPRNYFVQKDGATYLELQFRIAGVKIPPDAPRPVGTPIGKCLLQLKESAENGGVLIIPENVMLNGEFEGLQDDRLKTATFKILIPIQGAVIDENWD